MTTETGAKHSHEPIPKEKAEAQKRVLEAAMTGEGKTHREHVLKALGLNDEGHSLAELAKASGISRKVLQEVYNRGIGAYSTNPTSVRMKGSYKKGVDAPMSRKLSKEQWAMARAYSFLDGNPKHDQDLCGGGPMPPRADLQIAAEGSYKNAPRDLNGFQLVQSTPTLLFYIKNELPRPTVLVAIRGTVPSDTRDLKADASIAIGNLKNSDRYVADKAALQQFQLNYPPTQYDYYGTGHSLGGAILDQFLKEGLLQRGVSYNPAVQPQDVLFGDTGKNERIYQSGDPLYQLMGRFTKTHEVRQEPKKKKSLLSYVPYLGKAYDYLQSHGLSNFAGGLIAHGAFEEQLKESGLSSAEYLRRAKAAAKKAGLPHELLGFADDETHKLALPDPEGRIVKFGRVGYGDFILWTDAEKRGEVPKGYAKQKRNTFHKSHKAIKGDWKSNPYSPNNLALKVLW